MNGRLIINSGTFIYQFENETDIHYSLFKVGYGPGGILTNLNDFIESFDTIVCSFFIGISLAVVLLAQLLYKNETDNNELETDEESFDDDSNDEDENIVYERQYFKKLEEMPDKELTQEELSVISQHVLIEETPKGIVYMSYNVDTGVFDYYTDKMIDITYEILDTVARLFAITFQCKSVCVNYKNELMKGEQNMLSEIEFDKLQKELEEKNKLNGSKERSVFATYKSYNKGSNKNKVVKQYYVVIENANRFKYKGKISDYDKLQNKKVDLLNCKNISYSEFKKLEQDKE